MKGTITTAFTSWCVRCEFWLEVHTERTKAQVRKLLRAEGWKVVDGKLVCPKCVAKSSAKGSE